MNLSPSFQILSNYTYLNTANSGILSTELAKWRTVHDQQFIASGSEFKLNNSPIIETLRTNIADFFKAAVSNVFLTQNFSLGFNILLDGLPKTKRFLLLNDEYPSVAYPVTSRGFTHWYVDIDENLEDNIMAAIEKNQPTVFAFSIVQYISGYRMNPEFIKKLKQTYPDLLLIADGTQFCGTTDFSFEDSGLDALCTSGYKWLLAGYGNGFILLSDQLTNRLYEDRKLAQLPSAPFLKGKKPLAFCFEPGHLDTLNFGSLNESLNMIRNVGISTIEQTTQALCQQARTQLHHRGLLPDYLTEQKYASTIMSLTLDQQMVDQLAEAKILCSPRGTGTRISFHFYNTEEDLRKLLAVLDGKKI
ncbi:aminotransferase class V-fold PLP-dependent enzyme [Agrobacterium tumefaciens]|nr:aminotransferase class V-fold PLP-dependent enzyme [Agrobacterium tumefaciens]NTE18219.1 aminotransferase class V-fold PLP-dependent enzyme [Agrobacterium tumefaciens]